MKKLMCVLLAAVLMALGLGAALGEGVAYQRVSISDGSMTVGRTVVPQGYSVQSNLLYFDGSTLSMTSPVQLIVEAFSADGSVDMVYTSIVDYIHILEKSTGGVPYGVREAAVPKLDTAFTNMERVTNIPRPGYLVIYGQRDYYAFVHVGLVTDVVDRGDGVYQVFTVEGNMSSRIKRYCYLYDSNAKADRNMSATPENERTEPDVFQYTPHKNNWYVNEFCQTWY